jgi:preprotein translocase subunit YajC
MQPDKPNNPDERMDFILNTELEKPKTLKEKLQSKAGLALGGIVLIFILLIAVMFAASSQKSTNEFNDRLVSLAQAQTEILRISSLAETQNTDENTKTIAVNISETISADKNALLETLKTKGVTIEDGSLEANKNPQTDSVLVESLGNGQFDETFKSIMEENLLSYQTQLFNLANQASGSDKELLNKAYNNVDNLLGLTDQSE